ncbi:MAG: hypothetical protein NTZ67_09020 [Gammaproteobacteria bacterium]|nr:hypothetical protein [Gammaproteobacteria bacterium]
MHKSIKSSMLLAAAFLVSNVYAGGMTAEPMTQAQNPTLFTTIEGGYTWNDFGNTTVTSTVIKPTNSGWTGRAALGATHYSTSHEKISYTGEMGWGYYGENQYTSELRGVNAQNYIYGVDLLAGVDYQFSSMFDAFFKVGGLLENIRMDRHTDLSKYVGSGNTTGIDNETTTTSSVIPEIKVGGVYNFTNLWGLSLAYMHAFGNNVSMNVTKTNDGATVTSDSTITGAPVSLNSVTIGLRYKFD